VEGNFSSYFDSFPNNIEINLIAATLNEMPTDVKLQESFAARFCCIHVTALATMIGQLNSAMSYILLH
jgi:hypothetical protein